MSSNAKRMPEINLEDFERRLRAAGSTQGAIEDPLEELTRLVNTIAAERPQPEERVVDFTPLRAPRSAPPAAPQPSAQPEFAPPRQLPAPPPPQPVDAKAADAPMLRSGFDENDAGATAAVAAALELEDAEHEQEPVIAATKPARPTSWYLKVGGLVGVALIAAPVAAYWNLHGSGLGVSKAPPIIMAAEGPSKVAPPDQKNVQSPSDTGALLNKDSVGSGQVKVVSNQEQPLDLSLKGDSPVAFTKDSPIIAPTGGTAMVTPVTPASPSPSAASPAPSPSASASAPAPTATAVASSEPAEPNPPVAAAPAPVRKGPKTVSIRPDGTLITAEALPAATAPSPSVEASPAPPPAAAPKKAEAAPSVTTQASSPTLELPAKPVPAKTTTRVNVAKTDTTAPTEPASAPLQLGSAAPEKPQKLPTKLRPPQETQAAAQPEAAPSAGGGAWAVQLAAPRSEADAQSAIQRLQTKYASALGDSELRVHKADVNGDTIYRVRAGGLSKSEALSLCQKLKADGGDCFVAKN